MWTDTDHYRALAEHEDRWQHEVDRLRAEIERWKEMYVEAVSRPRQDP